MRAGREVRGSQLVSNTAEHMSLLSNRIAVIKTGVCSILKSGWAAGGRTACRQLGSWVLCVLALDMLAVNNSRLIVIVLLAIANSAVAKA